MSERRQVQFLTSLGLLFIAALVVFLLSIYNQTTRTQATVETNALRRDAQMTVLLQTVDELKATNRALGCLLSLDIDDRSGPAADACWFDQGLTPP